MNRDSLTLIRSLLMAAGIISAADLHAEQSPTVEDPSVVVMAALKINCDPHTNAAAKQVAYGTRYLTKKFASSLDRYLKKHGRDFDADPFTGSQEPEEFKVISAKTVQSDSRTAEVIVKMRHSGAGADSSVKYTVRKEMSQGWRIDDITYLEGGKSVSKDFIQKAR